MTLLHPRGNVPVHGELHHEPSIVVPTDTWLEMVKEQDALSKTMCDLNAVVASHKADAEREKARADKAEQELVQEKARTDRLIENLPTRDEHVRRETLEAVRAEVAWRGDLGNTAEKHTEEWATLYRWLDAQLAETKPKCMCGSLPGVWYEDDHSPQCPVAQLAKTKIQAEASVVRAAGSAPREAGGPESLPLINPAMAPAYPGAPPVYGPLRARPLTAVVHKIAAEEPKPERVGLNPNTVMHSCVMCGAVWRRPSP